MPTTDTTTNPYVGPRTFTAADRKRFFGRATEGIRRLSLLLGVGVDRGQRGSALQGGSGDGIEG